MDRRLWAFVVLLAVSVVGTMSAQRKPPTGREHRVPFTVGESLAYDVTWSDLLTAGTATVTVRERRPSFGSTAWYIVAEGRPTPLLSNLYTLYYKVDTLLDTRTLLPHRGSTFSREGERQRMKETIFDHDARQAAYTATTSTTVHEKQPLPGPTYDALGAIFVLRTMSLSPGATSVFTVSDSGEIYTVSARVAGRETVTVGTGEIGAWKIVPTVRDDRGQPFGEGLALWISDDARRVPVRLQATLPVGAFVLTLTEGPPR